MSKNRLFPRVAAWPLVAAAMLALTVPTALAQIEFQREPILYDKPPHEDPVARLQQQLEAGTAKLDFEDGRGYLTSVLKQLEIKESSQVLVYSKTSFQLRRISPRRPRALYFNDTSYVGWVQQGDVLEIMTTDPNKGAVFYTLSQDLDDRPSFTRDQGHCMACHASSRTQNVPGGLVRSVFVDSGGQPQFGSGTFTIDHTSEFENRWGGWYVTGTHGRMRHMGNVVAGGQGSEEALDREAGANVTDLTKLLDTAPYLTPHSDIVALMVLEHQTQMQNYLTLANYEARSAAHYDQVMNAALERPSDHISESTTRRIASAGEKLVEYMLFSGEFPLAAPVAGTSDFAEEFAAGAPRDSRGRSLRDFDLTTRLFKYPCSYLINTPSFDSLPVAMKQYVATRLREVLLENDPKKEFAHLTAADRQAIWEILAETKPELWND